MTESYLAQLTLELRRRDVPGPRIGEVIAEIEAHVAESGEPPTEAFGAPPAYAETVAAAWHHRAGRRSPWLRHAACTRWPGSFLLAHSILVA